MKTIYTKEFLISELHRFHEEFGRIPQCKDFHPKTHGYPGIKAYYKIFGKLSNAIQEAGFPTMEERYKDTHCIRSCKQCGNSFQTLNSTKQMFCSRSCSASYNNQQRNDSGWKMSESSKQQISKTLKAKYPVKSKYRITKNIDVFRTPRYKTTPKNNFTVIWWCEISGKPLHKDRPEINNKWCKPTWKRRAKRLADLFNIELRTPSTLSDLDNAFKILEDLYCKQEMSGKLIASLLNISRPTENFTCFLRSLGIKPRSLSESVSLAYTKGHTSRAICTKFKTGKHIDWSGNEHLYRSSYELDFYKELDEQNIIYTTESIRIPYYDTIRKKIRNSIPDVIVGNNIYEVKSEYTLDKQNMIDRFYAYKQHGYNLFIILEHMSYHIQTETDILCLKNTNRTINDNVGESAGNRTPSAPTLLL